MGEQFSSQLLDLSHGNWLHLHSQLLSFPTQSPTSCSAGVSSLRPLVSVKEHGYLLPSTRRLLDSNVMKYTLEPPRSVLSKIWEMMNNPSTLAALLRPPVWPSKRLSPINVILNT